MGVFILRAVIITNGLIGSYSFLKTLINPEQDLIICADGGSEHALKAGITPNIIVGDFDSASSKTLAVFKEQGIPFIEYPAVKDKTDTELAIDYAISKGYNEILLFGGFGSRIDHTLANIMLLASLSQKGIKVRAVDENNDLYVCLNKIEILGDPGEYISLIPLTAEVNGVTTHGLAYKLDNAVLTLGSTLPLSNRLSQKRGTVEIKDGILLVIKAKD